MEDRPSEKQLQFLGKLGEDSSYWATQTKSAAHARIKELVGENKKVTSFHSPTNNPPQYTFKPKFNDDKSVMMLTSYAKDVWTAMYNKGVEGSPEDLMTYAINLVKQAKEAFE
jgi:hypothetical protein